MIKTVIEDKIYLNEIVLPDTPLKAINSFIIKSGGDVLVIDTGFNLSECYKDFTEGLEQVNVRLPDINILATHLHADHCGLFGKLANNVRSLSIGKKDGELIKSIFNDKEKALKMFNERMALLDLEQYNITIMENPSFAMMSDIKGDFKLLEEGDDVIVGEYSFEVIDVPGHTPGHICLYDRGNKVIIVGDHVLQRITPNIAFWGFEYGDILNTYIQSLKKIRDLDVEYILSSHRGRIDSLSGRIDELIVHHNERFDEILNIFSENRELSVNGVASKMHWSIRAKGWEDFPNAQKWFASHEALSHLEHLRLINKLSLREKDGKLYYSLA